MFIKNANHNEKCSYISEPSESYEKKLFKEIVLKLIKYVIFSLVNFFQNLSPEKIKCTSKDGDTLMVY